MKKYMIVGIDNKTELEIIINKMMNEGWLPTGGVAINQYGHDIIYYQAMYKNKGL